MRTKIYISHANPEDNVFSTWLALKLMALGYEVWCDTIQLELGVDFWKTFEFEIRNNTKRFLFVSSQAIKSKDNALRELAVAEATRRSMDDKDPDKAKFMIALRIDPLLPFGEINPILLRTTAADFSKSWADGLAQVIDQFANDDIPRKSEANHQSIKAWWDSLHASTRTVKNTLETYRSNWFPVKKFPRSLLVYQFKDSRIRQEDVNSMKPAARLFKSRIITFGSPQEVNAWLISLNNTLIEAQYEIPVGSIIDGSYDSRFISNRDAKRILVELINKSWDTFLDRVGLKKYQMSNGRLCFWIPMSEQEPPHLGKGQLIGIQKNKHWHFAISGSTKLYPLPLISIRSHIIFTYDGKVAVNSSQIQHRARRRQGRNWWNSHWRDKLASMVRLLQNAQGDIVVPLSSDQSMVLDANGVAFESPVSYDVQEGIEPEAIAEPSWDEEDDESSEGDA
jgi:hypothetical protein